MGKIIEYINAHPEKFNMTVQFSVLSDYFKAIEAEKDIEWPKKTFGDFMPYADNDRSWWTGYYTSRPLFKGLVRESESLLRTVDSL